MKRVKVKEVEKVKYPVGTIKAFVWEPTYLQGRGARIYAVICVLSAFKVKKVRYRVLVIGGTYKHVYDLTENKLEEYYFQSCNWTLLPEKSLEFVVKFGNTPMGIVQECLESTSFQVQLKREVTLATTRLEKAQHQLESVEQLRKTFKEQHEAS